MRLGLLESNPRSRTMIYKNIILHIFVLLTLATFASSETKHFSDELVDSLIHHTQMAYGKTPLPPLLDTMVNQYETDSINAYRNFDFWKEILKVIFNDAKKRHVNKKYVDDSILNNIIIREFTNKDKMFGQFACGGFEVWMKRFDCNISPILLAKVDKPSTLRKHIWENCKQPNLETFTFNCRAFGLPDSLTDSFPYNTTTYKAVAGDTIALQKVIDSISTLKNPKELFNVTPRRSVSCR